MASHTRRAAIALALSLLAIGCMAGARAFAPLPAGGHHVLFIGNSLTYVNDLPRTLADLAASAGDTIRTAIVAFPDYALEDHIAEGSALRAVHAGGWQYVVLQQGPSSVEENRQNLIAYTKRFDVDIRSGGAHTALYQVWPASANFSTFQRALDSYALAAQAVNGLLLPVGAAWLTAWSRDSTLPLYASDGLHPSALATWLAALVMYERITGHDARTLPARVVVGGTQVAVDTSRARLIQAAAHDTNLRNAGR